MAVNFCFAIVLCPLCGGAETLAVRARAAQSGHGNFTETVSCSIGKSSRGADAGRAADFGLVGYPGCAVFYGANAVAPGGFPG